MQAKPAKAESLILRLSATRTSHAASHAATTTVLLLVVLELLILLFGHDFLQFSTISLTILAHLLHLLLHLCSLLLAHLRTLALTAGSIAASLRTLSGTHAMTHAMTAMSTTAHAHAGTTQFVGILSVQLLQFLFLLIIQTVAVDHHIGATLNHFGLVRHTLVVILLLLILSYGCTAHHDEGNHH